MPPRHNDERRAMCGLAHYIMLPSFTPTDAKTPEVNGVAEAGSCAPQGSPKGQPIASKTLE